MAKYFQNDDVESIESYDIIKMMHRADKKPENFIRLAFNNKSMRLDYKNRAEFEILKANLLFFAKDGSIYRYNFEQGDTTRSFYAAIDTDNFAAVSLDDPKYPLEDILMFNTSEKLLGIFKSSDSTIFILYDGTADSIGYGFYLEKNGYPCIYPVLMYLFDISEMDVHDSETANI